MMDVILNKKESIERSIKQIRLYYGMHSDLPFEKDCLKQDASRLIFNESRNWPSILRIT
jgi:hypothetical protein